MDEYHLEILRGHDLMGRWYLADVECKREIAERFTLFLGDDEMEFLADDALVFAYEGVTRMQQAWANAKKRKRRHRRAANDAARRKDEVPLVPEPIPPTAEEAPAKTPSRATRAATSELAKKLAAIAAAEAAASEMGKQRFTWAEPEALELSQAAPAPSEPKRPPAARKPRKRQPAAGPVAPPIEPLTIDVPPQVSGPAEAPKPAATADRPKRKRPPKPPPEPEVAPSAEPEWTEPDPEPQYRQPKYRQPAYPESEAPEPDYPEPAWIAPQPSRIVTVDLSVEEPVVVETQVEEPSPLESIEPKPRLAPAPVDQDPDDELNKRRQRRKSRKESGDKDLVGDQDEQIETRQVTDIEAARTKVKEPKGSGHHPAETNVGLLAKLRRPAKTDEEHVHTFAESRSAGGLTRRVCVECSHVSIISDD